MFLFCVVHFVYSEMINILERVACRGPGRPSTRGGGGTYKAKAYVNNNRSSDGHTQQKRQQQPSASSSAQVSSSTKQMVHPSSQQQRLGHLSGASQDQQQRYLLQDHVSFTQHSEFFCIV